MRHILYIILLVLVTSCNQKQQNFDNTKPSADHLINILGKVSFDTSTFRKMDCGLFINEHGTIAFKAIDNSLGFDTTKPLDVYLTSVYNEDTKSPGDNKILLTNIIDTASILFDSDGNFSDRNYKYVFNKMMDGGTIGLYKKRE